MFNPNQGNEGTKRAYETKARMYTYQHKRRRRCYQRYYHRSAMDSQPEFYDESVDYFSYPRWVVDCHYHHNYQNCRYGDSCYFRHHPDTRGRQICPGFRAGVCYNPNCPLRHNCDPCFVTQCPSDVKRQKCLDSHCPYAHRVTKFMSGFNCASAMKRGLRKWWEKGYGDECLMVNEVEVQEVEFSADVGEENPAINEVVDKWKKRAEQKMRILQEMDDATPKKRHIVGDEVHSPVKKKSIVLGQGIHARHDYCK